jgi:pyruvate-ferredoxin/flavodoxin oxidoreductase
MDDHRDAHAGASVMAGLGTKTRNPVVMDGNTAVAHVAYRVNEVCAIYPITPSSTMAELADEWSAQGLPNIWGNVPVVQQMQSEGGAAGAVHGALQSGALTTTFTASQGLLLMLPNMFKIAGELTPTVFHIAARALATQALSIFGDHSDVMAARTTGFAMLSSASVQEAHDGALIAQAATLAPRIPFLHFFDGFRTSHELSTIDLISDAEIRAMIDDDLVRTHRTRALSPEHPVIRGTAHNTDTFFQARETANPFYARVPEIVQREMDRLAAMTGRHYHLFDYAGAPDAERVVVLMGSGAETARATAAALQKAGEKVGVLQVRLYRPFAADAFLAALPQSVRAIAVLEQTKESGAPGEPLYLDVVHTLAQAAAGRRRTMPVVIGGRYGLSSKDFAPPLAKAVFDELRKPEPLNSFTVGILDDVSHTGLTPDPAFRIEPPDVVQAVFYGLGADGTVGANKNTAKIIAEDAGLFAQGYFVYDSHKSGAQTVSHLRFGPQPIHAPYLIQQAGFIGCHQFQFIARHDVLRLAAPGATVLLNAPFGPDEIWDHLPRATQLRIIALGLRLFVIDASRVAQEVGLRGRTNTVLQTCFFAISGVLPRDRAIAHIKQAISKTYRSKGEAVVQANFRAVDETLARLFEVTVPGAATSAWERPAVVADHAPAFAREVTAAMLEGRGDEIPVSQMPIDGTWPSGTAVWEKRNIAETVPAWAEDLCVQCGQCSFVCPHGVIQAKYLDAARIDGAPSGFLSAPINARGFPDVRFALDFAIEDCTGCGLCVEACPVVPVKALVMQDKAPLLARSHNDNASSPHCR